MRGGSPVRQRRDAASRFALRARFSLVDNPNKHMLLTHDPGPSPRHPSLAIHTPHPSMTLLERAQHLQDLASSGETIFEAIDTYYADDVEVVEATGETFHGRETQAGRVQEWIESVEAIHGGGLTAIAAHETAEGTGVVFAETTTDVTFKGAPRTQFDEVAVQRWEGGKVVHERFYYPTAGMNDGA